MGTCVIVLLSLLHFFHLFLLLIIIYKSKTTIFSIQREKIITSLFRKVTKVLANNFKIYINPFPNKPRFLRVCITSLLKTLREKEKLLVTSNFSYSHSVFFPFGEHSAIFIKFEIVVCKLFHCGKSEILSFGKGLIEFLIR